MKITAAHAHSCALSVSFASHRFESSRCEKAPALLDFDHPGLRFAAIFNHVCLFVLKMAWQVLPLLAKLEEYDETWLLRSSLLLL